MSSRMQPTPNTNSTITVAGARPKVPCKLRQTCDPCSEAKVKCDKGNPRCGRCERLSYSCVYSPARRFGRPRPRSRRSPEREGSGSSGGGRPAARDVRDDGDIVMTDDANSTHRDYAASQQAQQNQAARHLSLLLDEPLPDILTDESRWGAVAASASSASVTALSASSTTRRSHGRGSDASQPATSMSMSMADGSSSITLGGLEQLQAAPSLGSGMDEDGRVHHNPYEYDCATVAVATLRTLAAAAGLDGDGSGHGQKSSTQTAAENVLADQVPHACRQAARILVCPCSTDMDTALLAASLAAAILDAAGAALRALAPAGGLAGTHTSLLDDERHTALALATLPSVSQVVTLFTHRYSVAHHPAHQQTSRPPEALQLLAASLRTTLKAMAEETTSRFLDGGGAAAGAAASR